MNSTSHTNLNQLKVAIIVLNYQNWQDTLDCIQSLEASLYKNFSIFVVDNNSPNNSYQRLASHLYSKCTHFEEPTTFRKFAASGELFHQVEKYLITHDQRNLEIFLLKSKVNGGYSSGNNIGLLAALTQKEYSLFWILNNDTNVSKSALTELVAYHKESVDNGLKIGPIGSCLLYSNTNDTVQGVGGKFNKWTGSVRIQSPNEPYKALKNQEKTSINYPIGASMLISLEQVQEVGLLNEKYFLYYEELDYCVRSSSLGWIPDYCHRSRVYHKQGGSTQTGSRFGNKKNLDIEIYKYKSYLLFYKLNFPKLLIIAYCRTMISMIKKIFTGKKAEAMMILRAMLGE